MRKIPLIKRIYCVDMSCYKVVKLSNYLKKEKIIKCINMRKFNVYISILIVFFISNNGSYAEVYKWTDENGRVHYGSKPPAEIEHEEIEVKSKQNKNKEVINESRFKVGGEFLSVPRNAEEIEKFQRKLSEITNKKNKTDTVKVRKNTDSHSTARTSRKLLCQARVRADCSNQDLKESNYSGLDIIAVNFDGSNLESSVFKNSEITSKTSFKNANLKNTDFSNTTFSNVDFSGANLTGSTITNIICAGCIFDGANLSGAKISGTHVSNMSFKKTNMSGIKFSGSVHQWANIDLRNALNFNRNEFSDFLASNEANKLIQLLKYSYNGCDIGVKGADCKNKDLSNHKFLPVILENAQFNNADLSGADLSLTFLRSSDFSNVNLENAILPILERDWSNVFTNANMRNIQFTGNQVSADFTKVDFTGTDLSGIDFKRSNFSEAILSGANLKGTNLRKANLNKTILDNVEAKSTQFDNNSLVNSKIDKCETCKKSIEFGKIDVKAIKKYLSLDKNSSSINKKDKDAYNAYLELRLKAREGISVLESGQAILKESDLIEIISLMLSENASNYYAKAYRVIDKYNEKAWNAGEEASICLNDEIIKASLQVMSYENEKMDKYKGTSNFRIAMGSARIRKDAALCLSYTVRYKTIVQQAFIERFEKESNIDVKKSLVSGFTENNLDISLVVLTELLNSDNSELSSAAASQLSTWQQPPVKIIPWLINEIKTKTFIPGGYLGLLKSYGASIKDYIPELDEIYKLRDENDWTVHEYRIALGYIKSRSNVGQIKYKLKSYDKESILSSYRVSDEKLDTYHFYKSSTISHLLPNGETTNSNISNPVYSKNKSLISLLVKHYDMDDKYIDSIDAISAVEYHLGAVVLEDYMNRLGADVFVFKNEKDAEAFGNSLLLKKIARRKITRNEKVIYVTWGRERFTDVGAGYIASEIWGIAESNK
jgi:uncharacterized protein YjbI with pentapeptide repeats